MKKIAVALSLITFSVAFDIFGSQGDGYQLLLELRDQISQDAEYSNRCALERARIKAAYWSAGIVADVMNAHFGMNRLAAKWFVESMPGSRLIKEIASQAKEEAFDLSDDLCGNEPLSSKARASINHSLGDVRRELERQIQQEIDNIKDLYDLQIALKSWGEEEEHKDTAAVSGAGYEALLNIQKAMQGAASYRGLLHASYKAREALEGFEEGPGMELLLNIASLEIPNPPKWIDDPPKAVTRTQAAYKKYLNARKKKLAELSAEWREVRDDFNERIAQEIEEIEKKYQIIRMLIPKEEN